MKWNSCQEWEDVIQSQEKDSFGKEREHMICKDIGDFNTCAGRSWGCLFHGFCFPRKVGYKLIWEEGEANYLFNNYIYTV